MIFKRKEKIYILNLLLSNIYIEECVFYDTQAYKNISIYICIKIDGFPCVMI